MVVKIFIAIIFLLLFIVFSLNQSWPGKQKEKIKDMRGRLSRESVDAGDVAASTAVEKPAELQKQEAVDIQDQIMNYRLQSKERVRQIQAALQKAGYYTGKVDGKNGPRTKSAIKEFQKAKKLNPDGIVGDRTWKALERYLKD